VLEQGYTAGRRRDAKLLEVLDEVLERLRCGLNIGGERRLNALLSEPVSLRGLSEWLTEQPTPSAACPTFEIVAALFGDGSEPTAENELGR
jgi:hypothetical protein